MKRARILEEVLDAVLADAELAPALAKWDEEAAAAAAAAAAPAAPRGKAAANGKGMLHTSVSGGAGPSAKSIVAKVSPDTMWKSGVRAALEAFDKEFGMDVKRWGATAPPPSLSEVQKMVATWPCASYDALVGKVANDEYQGLHGADALGYDLLLLCTKVLLLMPADAHDAKRKARDALKHALALYHRAKCSLSSAFGPATPPRPRRRGTEDSSAFKERVESLLALDAQELLHTVPPVRLSQPGAPGEREGAQQDSKAEELKARGLRDMVAYADLYRSPEEVGVDLLVLCAAVILQHDDETVPIRLAAVSVAARGVLLFPKPRAISLKISLGRSGQDANGGSSSRPARRLADAAPSGSAEGGDACYSDGAKQGPADGATNGDRDRAARAASRFAHEAPAQQNDARKKGAAGGEGPSAPRRGGVDAKSRTPESVISCAAICAIECPGARELLKKCMAKLRDGDKDGIFEDAVTDDVAPGYSKVVHNPMCLSDMQQELDRGGYDRLPQRFLADLLLLVANALIFNQPGDFVSQAAIVLAKRGLNLLADKIREWNALLESSASGAGVQRAGLPASQDGPYAPLLARMKALRALDSSKLFDKPVSEADVPGYSTVIKLAMDLSSMEEAMRR